MTFAEELPELCPPNEAIDEDLGIAWRFVSRSGPSEEDFKSHSALGKRIPFGMDSCRWASCSLFTTEEAVRAKSKLASLREKQPIKIKVPKGSGMSATKGKHIDFWRFSDFDPMEHLISELEQ